jgi:hypothetical protein
MKLAPDQQKTIWPLIGFRTQGDFGPYTTYRSHRGATIFFISTSPKRPFTRRQLARQNVMIHAAAAWRSLSPSARATWQKATRGAHACLTGPSLFFHYFSTRDTAPALTLAAQARVTLVFPQCAP